MTASHERDRTVPGQISALTIDQIDIRNQRRYLEFAELYMKTQGTSQLDVWPLRQLIKLRDFGGSILGAYLNDQLVGLDVAVPGFDGGHRVMISGGVDVDSGYQGLGIGTALRWRQRLHLLELGCETMVVHMDPLLPRSPAFHIRKLGVVGTAYREMYFGKNTFTSQGDVDTDRLECTWHVASSRVADLASGSASPDSSNLPTSEVKQIAESLIEDETALEPLTALTVNLEAATTGSRSVILAPCVAPRLYTQDPTATQAARESLRGHLQAELHRGLTVKGYVFARQFDRWLFVLDDQDNAGLSTSR